MKTMKSFFFSILLIVFASRCVASVASVATIDTKSVPNGVLGESYFAVLMASGGCTPYSWKIVSGSLPAGVSKTTIRKTTSLRLTGMPTTAASYSFIVSVTGCGKHVSKKAYTVVIQRTPIHVVHLNWTASKSSGVMGYNVYRGPDGVSWRKVNSGGLVPWTHYADSTVANDSTYFYAASAVNIEGKESKKTEVIKAKISCPDPTLGACR